MILCSVHGARIMNLAFDFITPLAARYRRIASYLKVLFACLLDQVFTGVLKRLLEFFNSTRKRPLEGHYV